MRQKLLILGVIAAMAALSAVKNIGPQQASSSCCPGLPADQELHAPSQAAQKSSALAIPEGRPVWVLAHSDWCAQCQEMSKIASKVAPQFAGKVAFVELKVDDPEQQDLVKDLKISVIPTSVFLNANAAEIDRVLGVIPEAQLKAKLRSLSEER